MGYSLSTICWDQADFQPVADSYGWVIGAEFTPDVTMPALATARLRSRQLLFVNHKDLPRQGLPNARKMSMISPTLHFWVNDTSGVTNFSGHVDGNDLWAIWATDGDHGVEGMPPFDVQALIEQVIDEAEHDRNLLGEDEPDVDWYRLPVRAFEAQVGMRHSGAWPRPCNLLTGNIPVER